jgi:hypothetical protein
MIRIEETNIQLKGHDPFGRISGGFLKVTGHLGRFYADGQNLKTWDGEIIGSAFMDNIEKLQTVEGLLLSADPIGNDTIILLLATMSSVSSGVVGFVRKGLANIRRRGTEYPLPDFFQNCEEQTLTLI